MLAVSILTFVLVCLSPLDPTQANVGQAAYSAMSDAKREQLAAYWGSGLPFHERYFGWLADALRGDFGTSLKFNAPVADVIAARAGNSLALMAIAWVASGALGFTLGIAAGAKRGSILDKAVKGYCYLLASTPVFWIALVLLVVFSVQLGWFPIGFSVPIGASAADVSPADALRHMALPAIALSLTGIANIALHTREKTIDVMETDYVKLARARGMTTAGIVVHHGIRNLAMPAITLQFASIAEIFGGSVLVEQVFSYPGLGQAAVTAGLGGDAALLAAIAVLSAALVFGGNLIANLLYGVIDPQLAMRKRQSVRVKPVDSSPVEDANGSVIGIARSEGESESSKEVHDAGR